MCIKSKVNNRLLFEKPIFIFGSSSSAIRYKRKENFVQRQYIFIFILIFIFIFGSSSTACNKIQERAECCAKTIYFYLYLFYHYLYLWLEQQCNNIQQRAELCATAIYFYLYLFYHYLYLWLKQACREQNFVQQQYISTGGKAENKQSLIY